MQSAINSTHAGAYHAAVRYNYSPEQLAALEERLQTRADMYTDMAVNWVRGSHLSRIPEAAANAFVSGASDTMQTHRSDRLLHQLDTLRDEHGVQLADLHSEQDALREKVRLVEAYAYMFPSSIRTMLQDQHDVDGVCAELEHAMTTDGLRPHADTAAATRTETLAEQTAAQKLVLSRHERLLTESQERHAQLSTRAGRQHDAVVGRLDEQTSTSHRFEQRLIEIETRLGASETRNAELQQNNAELEATIESLRTGLIRALQPT